MEPLPCRRQLVHTLPQRRRYYQGRGNCSYAKPEYRNYFFQSDAHNVVKFNGKDNPRTSSTTAPCSAASSNLLRRRTHEICARRRHRPMSHASPNPQLPPLPVDRQHNLHVDDLGAHKKRQFPNGSGIREKKPVKRASTSKSRKQRLLGKVRHTPAISAPIGLQQFRPRPAGPLGSPRRTHGRTRRTGEYYSFKLPGITDRVKAVTAIILKDNARQKELPKIERHEGKDWIGLSVTDKAGDRHLHQPVRRRSPDAPQFVDRGRRMEHRRLPSGRAIPKAIPPTPTTYSLATAAYCARLRPALLISWQNSAS